MRIAVSDTMGPDHKFQRYLDWLKRGGAAVECVRLSYKLDNLAALNSCDALVLTGGHDVAPRAYGGPPDHPAITEVDPRRDEFERHAIDRVLKTGIPMLGICRGLQITNVHLGGSLLPDIEEAGYRSHRNTGGSHTVILEPDSLLGRIAQTSRGMVNSSHHQAVGGIGKGLRATARSEDAIIEAMELQESLQFFLLVQWHPERMPDFENPLSSNILEHFLSAALINEEKQTNTKKVNHEP